MSDGVPGVAAEAYGYLWLQVGRLRVWRPRDRRPRWRTWLSLRWWLRCLVTWGPSTLWALDDQAGAPADPHRHPSSTQR